MDPVVPPLPPKLDPSPKEHVEGLNIDVTGDEELDKTLANLEMAGEEQALGFKPIPHRPLSPEVRYLHVSRTIHELITDRNRSVGIFLFVASLLFAASTALLNAKPLGPLIIPLAAIQYWCLPITFGTLAVIGIFISLILIRTRIGLIYEVAKMNTLLGLPSERVRRVNPLSIFFLMHALVVLLGAACSGLTIGMLVARAASSSHVAPIAEGSLSMEQILPGPGSPNAALAIGMGAFVAILYLAIFQGLYYFLILSATADGRLPKTVKP